MNGYGALVPPKRYLIVEIDGVKSTSVFYAFDIHDAMACMKKWYPSSDWIIVEV